MAAGAGAIGLVGAMAGAAAGMVAGVFTAAMAGMAAAGMAERAVVLWGGLALVDGISKKGRLSFL